jgi:protease I
MIDAMKGAGTWFQTGWNLFVLYNSVGGFHYPAPLGGSFFPGFPSDPCRGAAVFFYRREIHWKNTFILVQGTVPVSRDMGSLSSGKCMMRIAVLITDLFEDVEYTEPASAFQEEGHTLVHVGLKEGMIVHGKKKQTPVTIEKAVALVRPEDFDALFIPGGYSPDKLRADDHAVEFVRAFMKSNKPIFSICHAPQLLITADVLRGRRVTGWNSIIQDIKNAGAEFVDAPVVEDGNLISSRKPQDLPAFISASLQKLTK